jgi:hypothetical protein
MYSTMIPPVLQQLFDTFSTTVSQYIGATPRGERAALPHIGATMPAADFGDGALKGVACAAGIGLLRRRLPDEPAQVDEVRLSVLLFVAGDAAPARDEFLR